MGVTLTNEMIQGAISSQNKYGVPASVTLGQIMLESGGSYPNGLSGLAYKDNNLFGVKAGSSWTGQTSTYKTTEYVNGNYVNTTAQFRKYNSVSQSIEDHSKLLNSSTYTNKTNSATSLTDYVNKMGSVYATDPNYANKLMSVINSNNLTKYDNGSLPKGSTTGSQSSTTNKTKSGSTTNQSSSGSSARSSTGTVSAGSSTGTVSAVYVSSEPELNIIGTVIKYIAILIISIIAIVFMLKGMQIDII